MTAPLDLHRYRALRASLVSTNPGTKIDDPRLYRLTLAIIQHDDAERRAARSEAARKGWEKRRVPVGAP